MGATHYWRFDPGTKAADLRAGYKLAFPYLQQVIAEHDNLLCFSYRSTTPPLLNRQEIWFNDKKDPAEDFHFSTRRVKPNTMYFFCKTYERGYDAAVKECLLTLLSFIPQMWLRTDAAGGMTEDLLTDGLQIDQSFRDSMGKVSKATGIKLETQYRYLVCDDSMHKARTARERHAEEWSVWNGRAKCRSMLVPGKNYRYYYCQVQFRAPKGNGDE